MVVIRLARKGAKKRPFYNIVATDKQSPRDGRFIEKLGYFNPIAHGQDTRLHIELERLEHWLNNGAQLSDRMRFLVKEYRKTQEK